MQKLLNAFQFRVFIFATHPTFAKPESYKLLHQILIIQNFRIINKIRVGKHDFLDKAEAWVWLTVASSFETLARAYLKLSQLGIGLPTF